MAYFYHYTTPRDWEKIKKDGLQPQGAIYNNYGSATYLPDIAHKPVIFLLPSPAPDSWLVHRNSSGRSALDWLLYSIADRTYDDPAYKATDERLVLLKVNLLPSDDVRGGDYYPVLKANSFETFQSGIAEYCQSVATLRDNFNAVASMKLPEILCFNAIPASRIEAIATTHDEIKAYLDGKKGEEPANQRVVLGAARGRRFSVPK